MNVNWIITAFVSVDIAFSPTLYAVTHSLLRFIIVHGLASTMPFGVTVCGNCAM